MNSKRGLWILSFLSVSILSGLSRVSAETNWEVFTKSFSGGFTSILDNLKLNPSVTTTILLGILLWIIIYSIVVQIFKFQGSMATWGGGVVSLIVVILTFIYLPVNFTEAIALQYSAMGATILTLLPFVILLYFTAVVSTSLFMARVIWTFYVVYYFTLFMYKIASISAGSKIWTADNIPYAGAIIAGIIVLFWVGWMRKALFKEKIESETETALRGVKVRETLRKVQGEEAQSYGLENPEKK